jgi:hypothetical protein
MFSKLIFQIYLWVGVITPQDNIDGRYTYIVTTNEITVEYAYKEEILNWIKTDEFVYNEDL